jgi:light-regulated signal transduction histidine kinase (bacteriophytochrome)
MPVKIRITLLFTLLVWAILTLVCLSLGRRIIQLHKGWISVDSVVGEGSVFSVRLPTAGNLK